MRMTIVPCSRAAEWIAERDARRAKEEEVLEQIRVTVRSQPLVAAEMARC